MIKKVFAISYNIAVFFFLQPEENIACNFFDVYHFQMIGQQAYLLPENVDKLSNLSIDF